MIHYKPTATDQLLLSLQEQALPAAHSMALPSSSAWTASQLKRLHLEAGSSHSWFNTVSANLEFGRRGKVPVWKRYQLVAFAVFGRSAQNMLFPNADIWLSSNHSSDPHNPSMVDRCQAYGVHLTFKNLPALKHSKVFYCSTHWGIKNRTRFFCTSNSMKYYLIQRHWQPDSVLHSTSAPASTLVLGIIKVP